MSRLKTIYFFTGMLLACCAQTAIAGDSNKNQRRAQIGTLSDAKAQELWDEAQKQQSAAACIRYLQKYNQDPENRPKIVLCNLSGGWLIYIAHLEACTCPLAAIVLGTACAAYPQIEACFPPLSQALRNQKELETAKPFLIERRLKPEHML